jgi:hypothetical protein
MHEANALPQLIKKKKKIMAVRLSLSLSLSATKEVQILNPIFLL